MVYQLVHTWAGQGGLIQYMSSPFIRSAFEFPVDIGSAIYLCDNIMSIYIRVYCSNINQTAFKISAYILPEGYDTG